LAKPNWAKHGNAVLETLGQCFGIAPTFSAKTLFQGQIGKPQKIFTKKLFFRNN